MSRWPWFFAALFAVAVHGLFFFVIFEEPKTIPPRTLPVKRIVVSVGEKKAAPQKVQRQKQKKIAPKLIPVEPKPQTPPSKQLASQPLTPVPDPQHEMIQDVVVEDVAEIDVENVVITTVTEPFEAEPASFEPEATSASSETASLIKQATPLYQINPPPQYPRIARRRGLQGVVVVKVLVDVFGKVGELHIHKSSGHSVLDKAALKTVRKWRFEVGTFRGNPKQMWVNVPVRFQLH